MLDIHNNILLLIEIVVYLCVKFPISAMLKFERLVCLQ